MARTFAALIDAASAAVREDPPDLAEALTAVPARQLFVQAARHRCAGLLLNGIVRVRLRDERIAEIRRMLQQYAAACTLQAATLAEQIDAAVAALKRHGIPHILLKTAARIYAGEARAEWSQTFDIDVLVPGEWVQSAQAALLDAGYTRMARASTIEAYRLHHHHLAPLDAPNGGKPLELHVRLAPRHSFTIPTDWQNIAAHIEEISGGAGTTLRLDAFGRGLHMVVHGAGLYRLGDAVALAADARTDPRLLNRLNTVAERDRLQRVPLQAVIAMAARLLHIASEPAPEVRRYLDWVTLREDLLPVFRSRMQFIDAWFANGGSIRGPATALAVPRDVCSVRRALCYRELAGRIIAGAAAWGYCRKALNTAEWRRSHSLSKRFPETSQSANWQY